MKYPKKTNAEFASGSSIFQEACSVVGLKPGKRQASKWRRGKGIAFKNRYRKENTNGKE